MNKKILTKVQRNKCLSEHKRTKSKRFADRIRVILLLDDGVSFSSISKVLFIDDKTVRNYKKTYDEGGLDHLLKDNYKGRPTKLSSIQEQQLSQHLEEKTYLSSKEIISYVKKTYKITFTQSGMRDLLQRLNFSYKKKPKKVPGRARL